MGFAGGASVVNKSNQKVLGSDFIHWPLTEVSPAASLVEPRLALMDDVGIWGQIVYPNAVGFGGQAIQSIKDEQLKLMIIQIWNDTMVENQEKSGGRIMGMGLLPWWDVDLAVAEVERFNAMGLHGVNTISNPHQAGLGLPDLADPYWNKLWEVIEGHQLPLNFHIGATVSQDAYEGSGPWPSMDSNRRLAIGSSMLYLLNARVISNFIFSGVLDRFPELKVVSVESGVGWLPFMLEALDHQADENAVKGLQLKPSEYFKRQMYACFWFESKSSLMGDIDRIGVDNCMFETDFPHPTCLYPQPLNEISKRFSEDDVAWDKRVKLLSGNAAKVYNVELPSNI
jgi:predicted TIM-barrel fold metal-dependent hydrolase